MAVYNGKKNPKKHKPKIDWDAIREDYLVQNLDPEKTKKYSINMLAKTWGVSRNSIDKHVKAEDWNGELRRRSRAIADARIDVHQDSIIEAQKEIRERHALVARSAIAVASKKLASLKNPKKLTVEQMVKMLAFGLTAEREASGMPKFIQIEDVTPTDPAREFETPLMRMERRRVQREVEKDLAEVHKRLHGDSD
ncbi:hypothetical protein LCGC14_1481620 [marine sediment metagenome]|uniref:Uncharacterized protein n=1 Tax=marine sediment metagenome TaxID=412755 RepID=A0A0F9MB70_9ZZZZ